MDESEDLETREEKKEGSEKPQGFFERYHGEWVEIVAAILLAVATVASAWSAYQSARWHGVQSKNFNGANADRAHATELYDMSDQQIAIDSDMFVDYMAVYAREDEEAAEFFKERMFSPELKDAVDAWEATDPLNNPTAPSTPFDMPQYTDEDREKADKLEARASEKSEKARAAIENADQYVLFTVLFASVLFFAGITTKFKAAWIRIVLLCLGGALFLGTLSFLLFQPVY